MGICSPLLIIASLFKRKFKKKFELDPVGESDIQRDCMSNIFIYF